MTEREEALRLQYEWLAPKLSTVERSALDKIMELARAQLEAAQKDAERWRALRAWPYAQGALKTTWPLWGPGTAYPEAADVIDAQIDEYMAAARAEKPCGLHPELPPGTCICRGR